MLKTRIISVGLIIVAVLLGLFTYYSQFTGHGFASNFPFKLGLDLNGGSHLVYQADVSKINPSEIGDSMQTLRDVIENRINAFGVSEPLVEVDEANVNGQKIEKLVVELPGVTDVNKAVSIIGQTPVLAFETLKPGANLSAATSEAAEIGLFNETNLTGRLLKSAALEFDQTKGNEPVVSLTFNDEGTALFAQLTKDNVGKPIAIFLDGRPISIPNVDEAITSGQAQISGNFTPQEAKDLVRNLNYGALPVPITLIGTQTIGASLGADALHKSVTAGIWGFIIISLFLILWYRLPGVIAVVSLSIYTILMLVIFKLIPVVLTSAGLAGFILSIGMAVDANILIFERMKEELRKGISVEAGIREGFTRAWTSIRDGNLSSIITAVILYYFATSSLIKGFALVFGIGVLVSMLTAVSISRTFLLAIAPKKDSKIVQFLFHNGFTK